MAKLKIDCMGDICPIPLIKTKKKMESMNAGDVLTVYVDHSCAAKNIPDWAKKLGNKVDINKIGDGEWEVIIKKAK